MGAPIINAAEFAAFMLVFLRVSMVVVFSPVLGSPTIITEVKAAICLFLAFIIAPKVGYTADMMPMTWLGFAILAVGEAILGYTLAFMVRLVLEAANLAGEYMSFQMGLSMVNTMDPQSGGQVSMVARLVYLIATLIFLYANGHLIVIKALIDSFQVAPPGFLTLWRPEMFTEVMQGLLRMYILGVKICAPVIAVLFCIKVSFGIVAKAVPQMNVLFVGMPVYIIVGFLMMGFSMSWWPEILGRALVEAETALDRLLEIAAGPA